MAVQQIVNRDTKAFVPNSKVFFDLRLGGKIRRIDVVVTGTVVVSAGTASGTAYAEGAPVNLVKRLILNATRQDGSRYPGGKIVDCSPRSLLRYGIFQHNGKFVGEQSGSVLGSGATGTYAIYMSYPIYFADATLRSSYQTALNTDSGTYQSLQLEVDTGNLASCFTGNDRTVDYSGLTIQYIDDRVGFAGDTVVLYQEDHVQLIAAAQDRMTDAAMPQDGALLQQLVLAELGSASTLSDTILQRLTVEGDEVKFDLFSGDIKQRMLNDEWIDPSQTSAGVYFIDWTDTTLSNTLRAGGLTMKYKVANPSGANLDDLLIYTRRVFAPAPAAQ